MWKNKGIRQQLGVQLVILLIGSMGMVIWNEYSMFIGISCAAVILLFSQCYTYTRYKQMKELTSYLYKIQAGNSLLDIRDNEEGELSILKNEVYKVATKLVHQAELLQQDKVFLSNAMSDISHQLKTPLTSMMMMAELLENESLPIKKRKVFLENIEESLLRMEWLVQSLLKLAKLDAGAVHMKQERISIQQVFRKAVQPLILTMEEKEQLFEMKQTEDLYVVGDEEWMVEAVTNILKNCMEHTKIGGTIEIHCKQNPLYTLLEIKDNGCGIEKEDLPHIFERFYRGKHSKHMKKESVGIGLALSNMILLEQKGMIEVESTVGVGTTFTIKLYAK